MVIGEIALQQTTKVSRIQNYNMIQAFTANRADQPFREGILPGTPGRSDHFFHSQGVDPPAKLVAIDRVTIPDQIPLGVTFRKRLGHLLTRPFRRRMLGDAKVQNSPALVLDDQENKQYPQANRRHREEVDGNDFTEVIVQECPPGLRRRSLYGLQDPRDGSFGDRDSELE